MAIFKALGKLKQYRISENLLWYTSMFSLSSHWQLQFVLYRVIVKALESDRLTLIPHCHFILISLSADLCYSPIIQKQELLHSKVEVRVKWHHEHASYHSAWHIVEHLSKHLLVLYLSLYYFYFGMLFCVSFFPIYCGFCWTISQDHLKSNRNWCLLPVTRTERITQSHK